MARARGDAGAAGGDAPAGRDDDHRGRVRAAGAGRRGRPRPAGAAGRARLPARAGRPRLGRATCTSSSPRTSASRPTSSATTRFMHELVELIVDKYDGSLKAEHGTGLNMAPFVEREWGEKATELMWRIKALADPDGVLGPGRRAQPRPRGAPAATSSQHARDRGGGDQVHRVRLLRAGLPVART